MVIIPMMPVTVMIDDYVMSRNQLPVLVSKPEGLAMHCRLLVLCFVCDSAQANLLMISTVRSMAPANCLVTTQRCLMSAPQFEVFRLETCNVNCNHQSALS